MMNGMGVPIGAGGMGAPMMGQMGMGYGFNNGMAGGWGDQSQYTMGDGQYMDGVWDDGMAGTMNMGGMNSGAGMNGGIMPGGGMSGMNGGMGMGMGQQQWGNGGAYGEGYL
jgi:hypothetical protein